MMTQPYQWHSHGKSVTTMVEIQTCILLMILWWNTNIWSGKWIWWHNQSGTRPQKEFKIQTFLLMILWWNANIYITMTSQWARWCLKSPASPLFTQLFIQGADQREHHSSASLAFVRGIHRWPKWKHFPRYWPFVRGTHQSPVNFPHKGQWRGANSQRASNTENVSIWWRHHVVRIITKGTCQLSTSLI